MLRFHHQHQRPSKRRLAKTRQALILDQVPHKIPQSLEEYLEH